MRSDMGRVVIERPRNGSSSPSLKAKLVGKMTWDEDGPDYDGPLRIPNGRKMHAYGKLHEKSFTDLLGPINGYLDSCVGRRWDDVYSEIARNLGAFSWPLQHIMRFHIDVETNTYLGVDGKIYAENKHGNECVSETTRHYRGGNMYVHPITRVLCRAKMIYARTGLARYDVARVKIHDNRWFVYINGCWFIGKYRVSPFLCMLSDNMRRRDYGGVEWPSFQIPYGNDRGAHIFSMIKQANRKDLKLLEELRSDRKKRGDRG